MTLYPTDNEPSKYSDANYVPRPLDSAAAAKARMIAKLEGECSPEEAIAAGLNGADEPEVVKAIFDAIVEEQRKLLSLDRTSKDYATMVAAECVSLDSAKWLAAKPALTAVALPDVELVTK